ncbi:MAG: prolyl oligopeptidase family serine peptidase [Alteromonadaceae bacterium]|nr:prolyl oligopeptidase family serine peptidase [Alteromonadaceae bacterium]
MKLKLARFKQIFTDHWSAFVIKYPRYNSDYYCAEITKMLDCGSKATGFAVYQCLSCGKGHHKVHFSCKGKAYPQCGKRYARESMIKTATRMFPGVSYRQVVLITTPIGQVADKLPAIMLPHGGPESYDRLGFDWMAQYFASQGYVVIQPQFRGSKGFGLKHLIKGRGEWGRKMQDDLTDAVNDLVSKGIIDKSRVCIVGASYGGYAALAGAVFTPDLYKCVVSINGVSDIKRMLDTEAIDHGSDHWVVAYWQTVISKGDVKKNHLQQISPINYVTKVKAPVLLIHGEWDEIVPFEQSENMFDELEDADKNVTFIELEKGDHYLSNAKNRMKALKAIDKFIKQFI